VRGVGCQWIVRSQRARGKGSGDDARGRQQEAEGVDGGGGGGDQMTPARVTAREKPERVTPRHAHTHTRTHTHTHDTSSKGKRTNQETQHGIICSLFVESAVAFAAGWLPLLVLQAPTPTTTRLGERWLVLSILAPAPPSPSPINRSIKNGGSFMSRPPTHFWDAGLSPPSSPRLSLAAILSLHPLHPSSCHQKGRSHTNTHAHPSSTTLSSNPTPQNCPSHRHRRCRCYTHAHTHANV
jgi:hypothetical protein